MSNLSFQNLRSLLDYMKPCPVCDKERVLGADIEAVKLVYLNAKSITDHSSILNIEGDCMTKQNYGNKFLDFYLEIPCSNNHSSNIKFINRFGDEESDLGLEMFIKFIATCAENHSSVSSSYISIDDPRHYSRAGMSISSDRVRFDTYDVWTSHSLQQIKVYGNKGQHIITITDPSFDIYNFKEFKYQIKKAIKLMSIS